MGRIDGETVSFQPRIKVTSLEEGLNIVADSVVTVNELTLTIAMKAMITTSVHRRGAGKAGREGRNNILT